MFLMSLLEFAEKLDYLIWFFIFNTVSDWILLD